MKLNVEDINSDKMIDWQASLQWRLCVTDATEPSVKNAVVWRDSMSQSLPTHTTHS